MTNAHRAIEAVWRIESAKVIAGVERKLLLERAAAVSWGTVKVHLTKGK